MAKDIMCPHCGKYPVVGPKSGKFGDYYACDGFRQTGGRQRCPFISERQYGVLEAGGTLEAKASTGQTWFSGPYYPKPFFDRHQYRSVVPSTKSTDEQRAIYEAIKGLYKTARYAAAEHMMQELLLVKALAGSGKTFSLVQASALLPREAEIIAIVYNKRNQLEMAERFPGNTYTTTINALGHMIVQKWLGRCRAMNKDKTMMMITDQWGEANLKEDIYFYAALRADDIVSKCKLTLLDPAEASDDNLLQIVDYYTVDMDGVDLNMCFDMVRYVLNNFAKKEMLLKYGIDYDDQVCIPVMHKLPAPRFHIAYVDEAQDINNARRALVLMVADRIVVVGDEHQAIYGFAGANTQSLEMFLSDVPKSSVLPLSVNWRCGTHIIEAAQCIVPDIKAGLEHTGAIHTLEETRAPEVMRPGDMGLCRTNAPLISLAYGFIKANVPVTILGRDIGKNLRDLVLRLGRKGKGKLSREFVSVGELLDRVQEYFQIEAEKIKPGKRAEEKLQQLTDKVESIKALCDGMRSIGTNTGADDQWTVLGRIDMLFDDQAKDGRIILCTAHKSKGLEAPRVFIFKPELMPFPYAKADWQIEQEYNLLYVAITRAMNTLVFCGPVPKKLAGITHLITAFPMKAAA